MADRHAIHAGGDVVARIYSGGCATILSSDDLDHVRDLAFAALAQEAAFLARHAEDAWAGPRGAEDAEIASQHVRRTFSVLDRIGWED